MKQWLSVTLAWLMMIGVPTSSAWATSVAAAADGGLSAASQLQAGRVFFSQQPPDRFVQGDSPPISVELDGLLQHNMYLYVEAWDAGTQTPRASFSQMIAGSPQSTGTYCLDPDRLASLPTGEYLIRVSLNQWRGSGQVTLDTVEQWVSVVDASAAPAQTQLVQPDVPAAALTLASESQAVAAASASSSLSLAAGTKQVVWNLKLRSGQTYRNLIIRGGVRAVWESINDVTFIDCDFRDAAVLVTVQARDDGSDASHNWRFIRCTFVGATRSDWGHSHGAFLQGVDDFLFRNCVFKTNGWLNGKRFNQNHHVYLLDVGLVRFQNCTFYRAAAQGIKCLGFKRVIVSGCTFRGNLIDIGGDDRSPGGILAILDCNFYNVGGVDSIGLTLGWSLHFEYNRNPLRQVYIKNCNWYQPAVSSNVFAVKLSGSRIEAVKIVGADMRQFKIDTQIWPKVVNQIGSRLSISQSIGVYR